MVMCLMISTKERLILLQLTNMYVLTKCFHESWFFLFLIRFFEKKYCLFDTNNSYMYLLAIYNLSLFSNENPPQMEYLSNVLESALLPWFFVYWVRDFKFWLLAYFLILLNFANFQQDRTTLILDIFWIIWIFGKLQNQKNIKGGPL